MSPDISWLVTRADRKGSSYGWRLHAVPRAPGDNIVASACGRRGWWGADLFVEKKCAHCLRTLGLACKACNGTGRAPKDANSMQCCECNDGEKR